MTFTSRVPTGKVPAARRCESPTDAGSGSTPPDGAAERDVPEHAGRYTFPSCSASPSLRCVLAKGAYEENLGRLGAVFREAAAAAEPPELIVAPETALTGYFLEGGVRDLARDRGPAVRRPDLPAPRTPKAPPLDVALGFYEVHQNRLYNSGLYATLGGPDAGIRHVHRKVFLPTYGVFDEERFVEAGRGVQAFDTRWGRAAMLICEDAWHSFTPMLAALDGAQLIIIPSASPARGIVGSDDAPGRPASLARWSRIVQDIAGEHGVYVALAAARRVRGREGVPGREPRGRPARRRAGRGAGVRGSGHPGDARFRGDHPRAGRPAAAGGPGDAAAAPAGLAARGAARRQRAAAGARRHGRRPRREARQPRRARATARAGARGHARQSRPRPARHRSRAHPALAGGVHPRRGAAPARVRAGRDRAVGRGGQLAGGVPRRGGARRRRT